MGEETSCYAGIAAILGYLISPDYMGSRVLTQSHMDNPLMLTSQSSASNSRNFKSPLLNKPGETAMFDEEILGEDTTKLQFIKSGYGKATVGKKKKHLHLVVHIIPRYVNAVNECE